MAINTYNNKDLQEAYQKLPFDLQEIILSNNTIAILQSLCEKYRLAGIKARDLKDEATFVLLGWTHPRDFINNLSEKLGVDKETARKIAEEVNQRIFQKVRDSLKQIHGIEDKPKGEELGNRELGDRQSRSTPSMPTPEPKPQATSPKPQELQPLEIKPISPMGNIVESRSEETIEQKIKSPPTAPAPKFVPKIEPNPEPKIPPIETPPRIIPIEKKLAPPTPPPNLPMIENVPVSPITPPAPPLNLPAKEPAREDKLNQPSQTEIKKELNIKSQPIIRSSDPYREQI